MNFEQFVEDVKAEIKHYLPEEFQDAQIDILQHNKLNESYLGMTVRKDDQTIAPTVNLEHYYEMFQAFDENLDIVMQQVADLVTLKPIHLDLSLFTNYEVAKEHLFIRVSDAERNGEILTGLPHRRVENLAITYHIVAEIGEEGIGSTPVTNRMLNGFGITEEQLHQDALDNSPKIFPAKVEAMSSMMDKMMREDMRRAGMTEEEIDLYFENMGLNDPNPLTVVTNEHQTNGAAVLFYPGQMEKLGETVNGDFFILPSSTHEVLILPDDGGMTYQELKAMVMEINSTQVSPEDRLADEVYHYDAKDRVFEKAESFEDRQKHKEMDTKKDENLDKPDVKPKRKSHDMSL